MGTNWPWNWRLTILKTIKMTLIRPLHDQFQDDCQSWLCCFCMELPRSVYKSPYPLIVSGGWGELNLVTGVHPLPPHRRLPASKRKQTCLSIAFWVVSSQTLNFGYNTCKIKKSVQITYRVKPKLDTSYPLQLNLLSYCQGITKYKNPFGILPLW